MIANASSSSATDRTSDLERYQVPLGDRLASLPAAFVDGRDRDLLAPLRFLPPGELPTDPGLTAPPSTEAGSPESASLDRSPVDRRGLARALTEANDGYGHPRAEELGRKLADPATLVVATGQQPGLLGGPLLTLSKAMAAVRYAEEIEARGESAVAVFWVATEDHDWAETARATVGGRNGPQTFTLGDDPAPLLPLGMRTFGDGLGEVADQLRPLLRGDEASARLERALGWYRPDTRFGEAFCRLMTEVLGERAPLLLDSMLPGVKQAQAPYLLRLVERRFEVDAAYAEADAAVETRGHALQVTPQPGVSPLFLLHGQERRRIEWRGEERFGLRGLDGFEAPVEQLLETLRENPSVVSPGVLARPAIQDAILGTTLQVMGPAEVSYMSQARAIYSLLGLRGPDGHGPWTTLRPQTLVLDSRQAGYLDELDVPLSELLDQPIEEVLAARLGEDFVSPVRAEMEALFAKLESPSLEVDPSLEKPLRKTRDQIVRGFDTFASKVASAVARRNEVWLKRFEQLHDAVLPNGHLQERELSLIDFWGRYGSALVDELHEQMVLDPRQLSVIRLGGGQ